MQLSKELITVTPFSRFLALILFFLLPVFAFFFGLNYQKITDNNLVNTITPPVEIIISQPAQPNKYKYKCPNTEYVDCMPGTRPVKKECSSDFLRWAQENCPNFKGGAY